jgi:hypothetical protein
MLEGEDVPSPLPLIRLCVRFFGAVSGYLDDFACGQKVAAPQNGRFGIDHHPSLGERYVGDGNTQEHQARSVERLEQFNAARQMEALLSADRTAEGMIQ